MTAPTGTLHGKVVIVTGAAGNLGRAVAEAAQAAGANTVLTDHAAGRLDDLFPSATSGGHLMLGGIDLATPDAARRMAAAALDRFGRIDALVNTVGGFRGGSPVLEEDPATWDLMMTMNLRTALNACRAVLPAMLERGAGAIVNVGAGAALSGPPGLAAYSASKAALLRLTESLAAETKAKGLRVNAVLPGIIDTPQNRSAMPGADVSTWVEPAALAEVVLFLASDAARAVTGAGLPVMGRM